MNLNFDYRMDYLRVKTEFKDLKTISDTKHKQELAVVSKIMNLLNSKKYDSVDEFYSKNTNLQDFVKKHMNIPITHFGHNEPPLNEEEYVSIIENMRNIEDRKKSFETEEIDTTIIDKNEYNSMKIDGKTEFVNNSNSNEKIEEKMTTLQGKSEDFQTVDPNKNTENMFKEIRNKQGTLNPLPLNQINLNTLTENERELYDAAINFQLNYTTPIKLDIQNSVIVDTTGNIMKITKQDGEMMILTNENGVEKNEEIKNEKAHQKVLTPNLNTLYSN